MSLLRRPWVATLVLLAASSALTYLVIPWSDTRINDLVVYRADAHAFLAGHLPYSGQPFEYPPLAALVMALPGVISTSQDGYAVTFALLILVTMLAALPLVRRLAAQTGGDPKLAIAALALSPVAAGAMLRTHFDLVPAVVTLAALALLVSGRPRSGMVVLGLGVMTKGFPIVIAPIALGWIAVRQGRRVALRSGGALLATLAVLVAISCALSPAGAWRALTYQTQRAPELESAPAAVLLVGSELGARPPKLGLSHGSVSVFDAADGIWTDVFYALGLVMIALLVRAAVTQPTARNLVLASLAATAAYAAFGKVLSPQFLVWTLPLLALAAGWREWRLAGAIALATVLTLVEFPAHYHELLHRSGGVVWLVVIRDAALLTSVWLAVRCARRPVDQLV